MANIYKLNYTASQVDEAIGNALSAVQPNQPVNFTDGIQKNGVDVLNANEISNPNLLINGDFRINQRGQTTYTGQSYAIDRWRGIGSASQMTVETNGNITLTNTTSKNTYYKQVYENSAFLAGQTVTMSVKLASVSTGKAVISIYTTTNQSPSGWTVLGTMPISQEGIYSVTATIPNGITFVSFDIGVMGTNSTGGTNSVATYEWAKVEMGSVATAFSPRPYAEELALCQRYYREINSSRVAYSRIAIGYAKTTNSARFIIPFNTMRIAPTVNVVGNYRDYATNNIFTLDTTNTRTFREGVELDFNTTGTFETVGQPTLLTSVTTNYIALDAEM